MTASGERVRIVFRLSEEARGDLPVETEALWCRSLPDGRFQIDNIPFLVPFLAIDDVIEADPNAELGMLECREVVGQGDHCTLRLATADSDRTNLIRMRFADLGCPSEATDLWGGLIAVDIPPEADLAAVRSMIDEGTRSGRWACEEACVTAAWLATVR